MNSILVADLHLANIPLHTLSKFVTFQQYIYMDICKYLETKFRQVYAILPMAIKEIPILTYMSENSSLEFCSNVFAFFMIK